MGKWWCLRHTAWNLELEERWSLWHTGFSSGSPESSSDYQTEFSRRSSSLVGDTGIGFLSFWESNLVNIHDSSIREVTVVVEETDSSKSQRWTGTGIYQLRFVDLQREGLQRIADRAGYARVLRDKLLAIWPVSHASMCRQTFWSILRPNQRDLMDEWKHDTLGI